MLRCISPDQAEPVAPDQNVSAIVDLSKKAIVAPADLEIALHRLQGLVISHPNPGLTKRLLSPLLLPLWALSSWPRASAQIEERYSLPARNLLKIFLRISGTTDHLLLVIKGLLFNGPADTAGTAWTYSRTFDEGIQVLGLEKTHDKAAPLETDWTLLGPKSDALMDLLKEISLEDDIPDLFLELFSRWVATKTQQAEIGVILTRSAQSRDEPEAALMEVTALQKMMERFPDRIVGRPEHILNLVRGILSEAGPSSVDEDVTTVALSLLNSVVSTPGFRRATIDAEVLQSIETALNKMSQGPRSEMSTTARNLSLLLKYRDDVEDEQTSTQTSAKRQVEDRKTYRLAMSYITQADSPPPVRSEGLNLIQGLIQGNSPILDVPAVLVLMSSLLDENEDYINLRVVKIFTQLAARHPKSVTKELLERYVDASEKAPVDARLRSGEALSQVIERLGETFAGDTAEQVGEALLSTAGRRGYRPKTQAKQAKDERLRALKVKRSMGVEDEAEDGPEDGQEEETEEGKARRQILSQIVEGWGSKQGSEDLRIRASALSIFAVGIETNVGGLGPSLLSNAVDLCLNVLALEPETEKGILRRSAVILILGFVTALDKAGQAGRRLGFGLTQPSQDNILRILRYIAATDNDGLVKQHAQDVVETLENWQLSSLLPKEELQDPAITKLAGLSVLSENIDRPKIEEIE